MDHKDLIKKIKLMGFSDYEAKCYLALFERESLTVSDVANLAKIPRPNAYEALEKLYSKGLIVSLPGKFKKFSVADPVFLKEKQLEYLHKSTKTIEENIEGAVSELATLFAGSRSDNRPLEFVEILKDRYQIHRKFMKVCSEAKKEILNFAKPPFAYTSQKERDEQIKTLVGSLKRGVILKTICEIPTNEKDKLSYYKTVNGEWYGENDKARVLDKLPIKLVVVDEKIAFFVMEDRLLDNQSITTIVVENQSLAISFKILFESLWDKAQDYLIINNRKYYLPGSGVEKSKANHKKITIDKNSHKDSIVMNRTKGKMIINKQEDSESLIDKKTK
jgi:HTH-type transcriptional regulator, sugar sensing transcriptional regulator